MTEILRLEWGNNSISFLGGDNGLYLRDYQIGVPQRKQQQGVASIFGEGTRPTKSDIGDATDIVTFDVAGATQDVAIANLEAILSSAIAAVENYWWYQSDTPVWIVRKANDESQTTYAVAKRIFIEPELPNIFAKNFALGTSEGPGLIGLQISLERTPWWAAKTASLNAIDNSYTYYPTQLYIQVNNTYTYGTLFKTAAGTILAGTRLTGAGTGHIMRSTDHGESFSSVASHSNMVSYRFFQLDNGDIIASAEPNSYASGWNWYRSQDDGATWSTFKTGESDLNAIWDDGDGTVYEAYGDTLASSPTRRDIRVRYSNDNLTTLNTLATIEEHASVEQIIGNGSTILLISGISVWRSIDGGSNWTKVFTRGPNVDGAGVGYLQMAAYIGARWILVGQLSITFISDDDGVTWMPGYYARLDFDQESAMYFYAAYFEDGALYINVVTLVGATFDNYGAIIKTTDGVKFEKVLFVVDDGNNDLFCQSSYYQGFVISDQGSVIFVNGTLDEIALVRRIGYTYHANSDTNIAFIGNFHNDGNLLNSRVDDGGVYSNTGHDSGGVDLFPAAPVAGDALELRFYVSLINRVLSPCFVFDLDQTFPTTTIDHQEYAGSFGSVGRYIDLTKEFHAPGIASLFIDRSDSLAITGGYYVFRSEIDTFEDENLTQPPSQASGYSFYAVTRSYVDITHTPGSIPSLMVIEAENISGDVNDQRTDRLMVGSRSLGRGENFTPFLPLTDRTHHNTLFMLINHKSANMAYTSGLMYTLRYSTWSAQSGDTSFTSLVRIIISNKDAEAYIGTFRVFVRGRVTSGSANDISLRAGFATGYSGSLVYTEYDSFKSTTKFEVLDLGIISLPFGATNIMGQLVIQLEGKNSSGAGRTVNLYDVVLMPVDEFAADAIAVNGFGGYRYGLTDAIDADAKTVVIDGANPRSEIEARIATPQGQTVNSMIVAATGKPVIKDNDTRLWFFAMTLKNDIWYAEDIIYHKIKVKTIQRFAALSAGA